MLRSWNTWNYLEHIESTFCVTNPHMGHELIMSIKHFIWEATKQSTRHLNNHYVFPYIHYSIVPLHSINRSFISNQRINASSNQSNNASTHQSIYRSTDLYTNQPINQSSNLSNQCTLQPINKSTKYNGQSLKQSIITTNQTSIRSTDRSVGPNQSNRPNHQPNNKSINCHDSQINWRHNVHPDQWTQYYQITPAQTHATQATSGQSILQSLMFNESFICWIFHVFFAMHPVHVCMRGGIPFVRLAS